MGTKNSQGRFDSCAEADPDEPTFTLFARDPMAPRLVRLWAAQQYADQENPVRIEEARACADAMDRWYRQHQKGGG